MDALARNVFAINFVGLEFALGISKALAPGFIIEWRIKQLHAYWRSVPKQHSKLLMKQPSELLEKETIKSALRLVRLTGRLTGTLINTFAKWKTFAKRKNSRYFDFFPVLIQLESELTSRSIHFCLNRWEFASLHLFSQESFCKTKKRLTQRKIC